MCPCGGLGGRGAQGRPSERSGHKGGNRKVHFSTENGRPRVPHFGSFWHLFDLFSLLLSRFSASFCSLFFRPFFGGLTPRNEFGSQGITTSAKNHVFFGRLRSLFFIDFLTTFWPLWRASWRPKWPKSRCKIEAFSGKVNFEKTLNSLCFYKVFGGRGLHF